MSAGLAFLLAASLFAPVELPVDAGVVQAQAAQAEDATPPNVVLDCPSSVRMGESLDCTLTITHDQSTTVSVQLPPEAEVNAKPALPEANPQTGLLTVQHPFHLFTRSMRDVRVRGIAVNWERVGGAQGRVEVEPRRVPVRSVGAQVESPTFKTFETPSGSSVTPTDKMSEAESTFFAAHGPLPLFVTNWALLIAGLIALVLAVGVALGVVIWRIVQAHRKPEAPYVDPRPAHVIAYEELEKLVALDLPGKGEVKGYYANLSVIIRRYLQRRYGVSAMEMTNDEIRESVRAKLDRAEARLGLDDFLNETELVKFADFAPSTSAIDTIYRLARGLIELTKLADAAFAAPANTTLQSAVEATPESAIKSESSDTKAKEAP